MASNGGGRVLGQYAACPEGGRRDLPSLLRSARRALPAGRSKDDPRVHRGSREGREEARYDKTLRGDDLARAYGRPFIESLLKRSRALGIKKNGARDLGAPGAGSPFGVEGHQRIYRERRRRASSRSR